jgi:hypothetical protein
MVSVEGDLTASNRGRVLPLNVRFGNFQKLEPVRRISRTGKTPQARWNVIIESVSFPHTTRETSI